MNTITQESAQQSAQPDAPPDGQQTAPPDVPAGRGRRRWRRLTAFAAAASVAAAAAIAVPLVVGNQAPPPTSPAQVSAMDAPGVALDHAAQLVAYTDASVGSGPIRHIRFRNLTDAGHPVYDRYIRPDGTALVGERGGALESTGGYLTSDELASLPTDPEQLRPVLQSLAARYDLALPGEAPERATFRVAIDLLTDPGVSPQAKAGIYRVIAGFDESSVRAENVGQVTDAAGRPGIGLTFHFSEGVNELLVLDSETGAILSDTAVLADGSLLGGQVYLVERLLDQVPMSA